LDAIKNEEDKPDSASAMLLTLDDASLFTNVGSSLSGISNYTSTNEMIYEKTIRMQ
jgi:hypothetical protein